MIYETSKKLIEESDNDLLDDILFDISPSNVLVIVIDEDLLTLNDTKIYEDKLKEGIVSINRIDNRIISKLIDNYKIDYVL